jgi:hypothetical protein
MTAAVWIGIAALVVSLGAAVISYLARAEAARSADAADRSAAAAEAADRRARKPVLDIALTDSAPAPNDKAIYRVRNDGPQDLDTVIVYRPRPPDRITYPITVTGGGAGWAEDEIDLGSVALNEGASFTLRCGHAD